MEKLNNKLKMLHLNTHGADYETWMYDSDIDNLTEIIKETETKIKNNSALADVSCCYPHLDKAIKDLEHKVNKEGFEDSRDLNSAYQVLLSIKATKKYFISNCR